MRAKSQTRQQQQQQPQQPQQRQQRQLQCFVRDGIAANKTTLMLHPIACRSVTGGLFSVLFPSRPHARMPRSMGVSTKTNSNQRRPRRIRRPRDPFYLSLSLSLHRNNDTETSTVRGHRCGDRMRCIERDRHERPFPTKPQAESACCTERFTQRCVCVCVCACLRFLVIVVPFVRKSWRLLFLAPSKQQHEHRTKQSLRAKRLQQNRHRERAPV